MTAFYAGHCSECGISFSDGYSLECRHCSDRRRSRLKRGTLFSPTGFAGEMIDNTDERGRIVAMSAA